MPSALDLAGSYAQVFQANIAYDTVLDRPYELAGTAETQAAFQKQAVATLSRPQLEMLPQDLALARQLHLDSSPRASAVAALKKLFGFQSAR